MDPKYANLPGIVRDILHHLMKFQTFILQTKFQLQANNEPDVYETAEVPGGDQKIFEDDSNNVPKIFVSTKEAFDKYNKTDFSGKGVGRLVHFVFFI